MFITLQIDLTVVGRLMRENADLVKKVNFKDGEHQLLNVIVGDRKEVDNFGNNLNISCRPKDAQKDNKWYIGKGKLWPDNDSNVSIHDNVPSPLPSMPKADDAIPGNEPQLPF